MTTRPQHHPQDDLLVSHASRSEHPAVGLLMSTHAALCDECRHTVKVLETVGATLFEQDDALVLSGSLRDARHVSRRRRGRLRPE